MEVGQISQDSINNKERLEIALNKKIEEIFEKHIKLLEPGKPHRTSIQDLIDGGDDDQNDIWYIALQCLNSLEDIYFVNDTLAMENTFRQSIENSIKENVEKYVESYNEINPNDKLNSKDEYIANFLNTVIIRTHFTFRLRQQYPILPQNTNATNSKVTQNPAIKASERQVHNLQRGNLNSRQFREVNALQPINRAKYTNHNAINGSNVKLVYNVPNPARYKAANGSEINANFKIPHITNTNLKQNQRNANPNQVYTRPRGNKNLRQIKPRVIQGVKPTQLNGNQSKYNPVAVLPQVVIAKTQKIKRKAPTNTNLKPNQINVNQRQVNSKYPEFSEMNPTQVYTGPRGNQKQAQFKATTVLPQISLQGKSKAQYQYNKQQNAESKKINNSSKNTSSVTTWHRPA